MLKNFIKLTLKSLIYRPMRSWLTVIGIVIGIMLVVIILAIGSGIQNAVTKTLQMFGSDLIVVFPGKETNPLVAFVGGQKFKEDDLIALEKIDGVKFVVPELAQVLNVEFDGEKKSAMIHATLIGRTVELVEESKGFKLREGRWPSGEDAQEAVLGSGAADNLFQEKIKIGDEVIVKSKRLKVVGIMAEIGEQMSDNIIFVSLNTLRAITGLGRVAASADVKLKSGTNVELVAKQIRHQLSKQDVVRDFSVLTPDKAGRLVGSVLSIVELILIVFGLVSLIVGAVGIMNTMYTSVLERTKQIGIMKAVGASNESILALFLVESGLIGLVGGITGVIFGIGSAYMIGWIAAKKGIQGIFSFAALDVLGFFAVLIVTFIVGVIAGLLPARKASRMEPAEALRYE